MDLKRYYIGIIISIIFYFFTWKLELIKSGISGDLFFNVNLRIADALVNFERLFLIVYEFIINLLPMSLLFLISTFISRNFSANKLPFIFIGFYLIVLFFVYALTPHDLKWHLATSVGRTLMPVNVILLTISILKFK
jgi:hypothetical protein